MGSRIHIKLDDVLNSGRLKVEIAPDSVTEGLAATISVDYSGEDDDDEAPEITGRNRAGDSSPLDEVVMCYNGNGELSADFNFFRYPAVHQKVMKFLYEHGVNFTVIH